MSKFLKLLFGVLLSSLCLFTLFQYTGSLDFHKLFLDLNYVYLVPLLFSVVLSQALLGYRYFLLLDKKIPLRLALCFSILGNSANLILPVRGGELLKGYLSQKASSLGYFSVISRILLERSLDLVFAITAGVLALGALLLNEKENENIYAWAQKFFILLLLLALLVPTAIFIIKKRLDTVLGFLKKLFGLFRKERFIEEHIRKELYALRSFLSWSNLCRPLLLSLLIWLGVHFVAYISVAYMQALEISYWNTLFLLFAGAMSLLLPSAPSGVGVLHASLSSALLFIGYPIEKALPYAFLNHFCISLSLACLGLCVWLYFSLFLRKEFL